MSPREPPTVFFLPGMLLPLSAYLLALGLVNRRREPLVVPGVLDGIALVAGLSGFFLFGGPLVLRRVGDQLYLDWLATSNEGVLGPAQVERLLGLLYFVAVACLVAYLFARQRHLTGVYNAEPDQVEAALDVAFDRLGLSPVRSGRLLYFPRPDGADGVATVLEVEPFAAFRHVTLRWDPADAPLRARVEAELADALADVEAGPGDVGFWLLLAGVFLFGLAMVGVGIALAAALRA